MQVLYFDEHVLITRGNKGTIYCATRDGAVTLPPPSIPQKADAAEEQHANAPLSDKKRKAPVAGDGFTDTINVQKSRKKNRPAKMTKPAMISPSPTPDAPAGVPVGAVWPPTIHTRSNNVREENVSDASTFDSMVEANSFPQNQQRQQHDGGVRNILSSVEAFFSWGA